MLKNLAPEGPYTKRDVILHGFSRYNLGPFSSYACSKYCSLHAFFLGGGGRNNTLIHYSNRLGNSLCKGTLGPNVRKLGHDPCCHTRYQLIHAKHFNKDDPRIKVIATRDWIWFCPERILHPFDKDRRVCKILLMKSEYLQGHLSTLPRGFWPTKVFFTTYCGKCTIKVNKSKEVSNQTSMLYLVRQSL